MSRDAVEVVVIGASAGAVPALLHILPALPQDYRLPVLIAVHVPPDRDNALVQLFQSKCAITVKEAEDKEPITPGVVYFAPSDYHLLVEADRSFSLSTDAPVNHSRPAIDVLLESAADALGPALAGVILTGANDDGAQGLAAIVRSGGVAVVETPEDAYSSTMPRAALQACPSARALSLDGIRAFLLEQGAA